jgi:hypothetical protein
MAVPTQGRLNTAVRGRADNLQHVSSKICLRELIRRVVAKVTAWIWWVNRCLFTTYGKGKGNAIPLQAWTGPEGSKRLRLPDFKTIGTCRW